MARLRVVDPAEEAARDLLDAYCKNHQRKARKPTLSAALKQAAKAGTPVRRASQAPDGTVTLVIGEPEPTEASNPWLAEAERLSKQ
jgi:hypothetical protein